MAAVEQMDLWGRVGSGTGLIYRGDSKIILYNPEMFAWKISCAICGFGRNVHIKFGNMFFSSFS